MNHNEEVPDFLGGLGDMLPADVLKKTRITKAAPCSSMPQAASTWINSLILEPTPDPIPDLRSPTRRLSQKGRE